MHLSFPVLFLLKTTPKPLATLAVGTPVRSGAGVQTKGSASLPGAMIRGSQM